ncbi:YtxH domain-containing protein [Fodinibius sp.]|uniref:YtxH domain-containing protein n=1 Tax=Fodinibius sp. TaxID=1872440 RepID=UPI0035642096
MIKKSIFNSLLLATGSFIGGVTLGVLLTPKSGRQNRAWLTGQADELTDWMERRRNRANRKGRVKLHHIRKNVHDGLKQNIPDLYEATERIDLTEQELINER